MEGFAFTTLSVFSMNVLIKSPNVVILKDTCVSRFCCYQSLGTEIYSSFSLGQPGDSTHVGILWYFCDIVTIKLDLLIRV